MPKLNKSYDSLFNFLTSTFKPLQQLSDKMVEPDRHSYVASKKNLTTRFIGAFQPFQDMGKDFIDVFKPYKSVSQVTHDLAQPVSGFWNILKGTAHLLVTPLVFLIYTPILPFICEEDQDWKEEMAKHLVKCAAWMIEGIANIIRGITEVLFTPFTWSLKTLIRAAHTAIKVFILKEKIYAENNTGIQQLVEKANNLADNDDGQLRRIAAEIHSKYEKAKEEGQATRDSTRESQLYKEAHNNNIIDVLRLKIYCSFFSTCKSQNTAPSQNTYTV